MRKRLKAIFLALGLGCLALFALVFFGGRWAVDHYLTRELAVGDGRLQLVGARFRWSLDLRADAVVYTSPALRVAAGRTVVSADLFRSLTRFQPTIALDVDTVLLRLIPRPEPADSQPLADSIAFPSFRIPVGASVRVGRLVVEDSGGRMARLEEVELKTKGPQGLGLTVGKAVVRQTGPLEHRLESGVAWDDSSQVVARLVWGRGRDHAELEARLPKSNVRRASVSLRARVASSRPYAEALGLPSSTVRVEGIEAGIDAAVGMGFVVDARIGATVSGFPDSLPVRLGSQKLSIGFKFRDSAGTWSIRSRGDRGERVDLRGSVIVDATDSLANPAWLARHAAATADGRLGGFVVKAGGATRVADLEIADLRVSENGLAGRIATGDGSRVQVDLRKKKSGVPATAAKRGSGRAQPVPRPSAPPAVLPGWSGIFSARVAPGERWLTAFTDTQVVFKQLQVAGDLAAGEVRAVVVATGLKAYGVMADSLHLVNRYGNRGYVLEPSHLVGRGVDWELSGQVELSKPDRPLSFRFANPSHGSVDFSMRNPDRMEAHVRDLRVDQLPYKGLDSLPVKEPRLAGDFVWDKRRRDGSLDLELDGRYKDQPVRVRAMADWDAQNLSVREIRASLSGRDIVAAGKLDLHGGQFYELAKVRIEDVQEIGLEADRFDLAKALSLAMEAPPLRSGVATGKLEYRKETGFSGTYRFEDLHRSGQEEKITVKELALVGKGDTLVVVAQTLSEVEPLFRDSIHLAVTGVLTPVQTLALEARLGDDVYMRFRGTVKDFDELQGRLGMHGDLVLPGSSGELRDVKLRADVSFPFKEGLQGLRLEADTLGAVYVVTGIDTQTISAPVKMREGKIVVPRLSIHSRDGAKMDGRFSFDPATRQMSGSLQGDRLSMQFGAGDKIRLEDIRLDLRSDARFLEIQGTVGSGWAEHIKAPMRAAGQFSRLAVSYKTPMGKDTLGLADGEGMASLKVAAVLDTSELRYRLRSMETLQNLFKRSPRNNTAKRNRAMQMQIDIETSGRGNSIETDILRMNYVGNFSMSGVYPYALVQGRVSSQKGELGLKGQAYAIRRMDLKWLNTPLEEGQVDLQAEKRLARNCEAETLDSCNIATNLTGELSDLKFGYESDCQGASGAGVEVAALIYSVRRGCYSSAMAGGGSGLSYQQQALGLLEPMADSYLSDALGKLSGHWISSAKVTGLGSLVSNKEEGDSSSSAQEALALELLSREFWRLRLRVKSAYAPENTQSSNPWNVRLGLEWRPPVPGFIEDPIWRERLENHVKMEAAVFTDPDRTKTSQTQESLRKWLGLNYTYDFWEIWGIETRPAALPAAVLAPPKNKTEDDSSILENEP